MAQRVMVVRIYEGAGRSVFAGALLHATANVSWQLFPSSHWDPRVNGLILAGVAVIVSG